MAAPPPGPARVTTVVFTTAAVSRAVRASARGVAYLVESVPELQSAGRRPGAWNRRSEAEVSNIAVAARLLRFGFPPHAIGAILAWLATVADPVVYISRGRDGTGFDVLVSPDPAAFGQGAVLRLGVAAIRADAIKRLTATPPTMPPTWRNKEIRQ